MRTVSAGALALLLLAGCQHPVPDPVPDPSPTAPSPDPTTARTQAQGGPAPARSDAQADAEADAEANAEANAEAGAEADDAPAAVAGPSAAPDLPEDDALAVTPSPPPGPPPSTTTPETDATATGEPAPGAVTPMVPAPAGRSPRRPAIGALCDEVGGLLGSVSVADCLAAGLVQDEGRSREGRALAWVEFPARTGGSPRVLVIGGIHGDEYSSVSMVFRWIERLAGEHDGDQAWRLIPAANPDGLLGVRPARRTNANGVDLNRNFATRGWEPEARQWWESQTSRDPRRRPGDAPASEPETRWLQAFIDAWAPDVIVALHAPHALLDFDATASDRLAAPQRLGFLRLQPLGTFPGSLGRYGSMELGVPVLTLELPWAGIMPAPDDQAALWRDLASWLERHLPAEDARVVLTGP